MTEDELCDHDFLTFVFSGRDKILIARVCEEIKDRAKKLGCLSKVKLLLKLYKEDSVKQKVSVCSDMYLETSEDGKIKCNINNFERILRNDSHFYNLQKNEMTGLNETVKDGKVCLWTDGDDCSTYSYIQENYGIYSPSICNNALTNIFNERAYHPLKEKIEGIVWDKTPRIKYFLHCVLLCEDNEYTREVSRLIFAGGIHRIYNPGCKFDTTPVLIGSQGEGKSTVVRWLSMCEDYYTDVFTIEGKDGLDCIRGKWICEFSELLAVTKAKEVEAVKSFLSRQSDYYRKAYERNPTNEKRQCIFIGTTNREQFLTDKTGNRRFLPVKVNSKGNDIYENEKFIKEYIEQCWAEAYSLYREGMLSPTPDYTLEKEIKEAQQSATEHDYRIEAIKNYLYGRDKTCVLALWQHALGEKYTKPTRKDSTEIGLIMQQMEGWERPNSTIFIEGYGSVRGWNRKKLTN